MGLNVYWNKCRGDVWCQLLNVNLDHDHFNDMEGVYIIWHGGQNPATVRVGQGFIKERLGDHRIDPTILDYTRYTLYVTWAKVPANYCNGVERHLAERLDPKIGSRYPDVYPIEVKLPW